MMDDTRDTEDRILSAFLRLVAEGGLDGVTTREIATEAGVNPVTLFRRFGDKTTIALEAIRRFSPAPKLLNRDPAVDPENAIEGLVACLLFLADLMEEHPPWLRLGVLQASRIPEVQAELAAIPEAIYDYLRRTLAQVSPALRPEVDHHATALQWMGMLMAAKRLRGYRGGQEQQPEDWRALFQAAIRPLLREV